MLRYFLGLAFLCPWMATAQVMIKDAEEKDLGYFLQASPAPSLSEPTTTYQLLSPGGFRYFLTASYPDGNAEIVPYWDRMSEAASYVRFESEDCSGQAFMKASYPGFLTRDRSGLANLWYAPYDGQASERTIRSSYVRIFTSCRPEPEPITLTVFPVLANDPDVTGIQDVPYVLPLKFEPTKSDCVFQDRFDCT